MKKIFPIISALILLLSVSAFTQDYPRDQVVIPSGETYTTSVSYSIYSQKLEPKSAGENRWELINENGDIAGILEETKEGNFNLRDRNGNYGGLILSSGVWMPRGATTTRARVTAASAQLFLDALAAIEKIK
ncbi:MAG: hypothetical protein K9L30_06785 [Desulfobacterales bacterium]|nr:hypothetical protein [Desulfobacterales bacterium]